MKATAPLAAAPRLSALEIVAAFVAAHPEILDFGVTLPKRAPSEDRLRRFLSQGYAAGMNYMHNHVEQRVDAREFAPWAKSLVFFALRPPSPLRIPASESQNAPIKTQVTNSLPEHGQYSIAAYAQGPDYHFRARELLQDLQTRLASLPDGAPEFRGFVDTAPVFERDFAAEAGLGWRAKNCTLIHRKHGSHFLLFGCAISLELPTSTPVPSFCGGCTLCLQACPTQAFLAPGEIDAGKCISYWTIEQRGLIPAELEAQFGEWIFGCDRCQTVCPWNRKHLAPASPAGATPYHQDAATWLEWLAVGGGLQSRFKKSPLQRAGRKGLLRNVVGAIARTNRKDLIPQLEALQAQESDSMLKQALERAIVQLQAKPDGHATT